MLILFLFCVSLFFLLILCIILEIKPLQYIYFSVWTAKCELNSWFPYQVAVCLIIKTRPNLVHNLSQGKLSFMNKTHFP